METQSAKAENERGHHRRLVGIVTSDRMDKTVVVVVTRRVRNSKFEKYQLKRAKYKAHSADNAVHIGDKVLLCESRPLSRDKRWRVEKLLEKARQA